MGTWGAYLACQAPDDATKILPPGATWGPEPWSDFVAPGWSIAATEISAIGDFDAITAQAAGHALFAVVLDSDVADVTGTIDGKTHWELHLNEKRAEDYDLPGSGIPNADNTDLHQRLATWIESATGRVVPPERIRDVVTTDRVFADDSLRSLLYVIGITTEHTSFGDDRPGL
ncbi:hypothetical protein [Spongiactinospora sp. 9N601]|uniref:hypothetical protein n=1 Tax=Spongiactinospora sp. 9N601 TaxID=3375149 RepID=UPI0037877171